MRRTCNRCGRRLRWFVVRVDDGFTRRPDEDFVMADCRCGRSFWIRKRKPAQRELFAGLN